MISPRDRFLAVVSDFENIKCFVILNVEKPPASPTMGGPTRRANDWLREFLRKERAFVKFALVGATGLAVNEAVLYSLTRIFGASQLDQILAQAIGVELAIINNFTWNDRLTFRHVISPHSSKISRFVKYNLLSLVTLTVNLVVFSLLINANVWYIFASIIAIVAAFGLNYFGSSRWAWRKHKTRQRSNEGRPPSFAAADMS